MGMEYLSTKVPFKAFRKYQNFKISKEQTSELQVARKLFQKKGKFLKRICIAICF